VTGGKQLSALSFARKVPLVEQAVSPAGPTEATAPRLAPMSIGSQRFDGRLRHLFGMRHLQILACAMIVSAQAQDRGAVTPRFEVASVKPSVPTPSNVGAAGGRVGGQVAGGGGVCAPSLRIDPARVDIRCATLPDLIGYAFRFSPARISGPDWMTSPSSPRFDIAAKTPQGASSDQVPEMVRALLADRFKLITHRGTAERAVYALVVAKGGLKVQPAGPVAEPAWSEGALKFYGDVLTSQASNADASATTIGNPRMGTVRETGDPHRTWGWEAPNITLGGLADLLDKVGPWETPVIDKTGLAGRYRLVLEVAPSDLKSSTADDMEQRILGGFNDGLRKLGLQLERRKGTVETLVVDHVEKTPSGN